MKRRDLLSRIAKQATRVGAGWHFDRSGGKHDIWVLDGSTIPIPRHNEIGEGLAESIFKECEFALGRRWWK